MEEYKVLLIDLLNVPLIWLLIGLFLLGQCYLFYIRRFGRALIRKLCPYARYSLSSYYMCRSSLGQITLRYIVPSYNPDELQVVMKTHLKGNYHFIDANLSKEYDGHINMANSEASGRIKTLFKLVSDTANSAVPIMNWDLTYSTLSEIKSLGFQHIQVQQNELIIGNADVKQDVLEDENKLSELKQNIDKVIELGRKLSKDIEQNQSFVQQKSALKTYDPIAIIMPACMMFIGLVWFIYISDIYPLIDESQLINPLLSMMGVSSSLLYIVLAIRNKSLFRESPVIFGGLVSVFLGLAITIGLIGPAVHYNAYFDNSEAVRVEGKVIEIESVDNKSLKYLALLWLLGQKYGNQAHTLFRTYRVKVQLPDGNANNYSISKSLWDTLHLKEEVEVFIRDGALGWKWLFRMQPISKEEI